MSTILRIPKCGGVILAVAVVKLKCRPTFCSYIKIYKYINVLLDLANRQNVRFLINLIVFTSFGSGGDNVAVQRTRH